MTCNPRHHTVPAPRPQAHGDGALQASRRFLATMFTRRSVRDYSPEPVDPELIRNAIATAGSAPSGAHVQPWRFVVVSDPALKRRIREGAEEEERAFYSSPGAEEWRRALEPLGTDADKPHLEHAPVLIVVFEVHASDTTPRPYYVKESVGIAVGLLLASLHQAGLATLVHTPSPMRFLNDILGRPSSERPFCVIPAGRAAADATVPDLARKDVDEIMTWLGEPGPPPGTASG